MEARVWNSILDFETLFSDLQELLNGSGLRLGLRNTERQKEKKTRGEGDLLFRREVQRVFEILSIKPEYLTQKKERDKKPSPGRARVLHVAHTSLERKRGGLVQPAT